MKIFGKAHVTFWLWSEIEVKATLWVMDIRRPLLAIGKLCDCEHEVVFSKRPRIVLNQKREVPLLRLDELYFVPISMEPPADARERKVMPLEKPEETVMQIPWTLFEYCCSPVSLLAAEFAKSGQRAFRLGLPDLDLRLAQNVQEVIDKLQEEHECGRKIFLWATLPCTCWCR